jgi:glucose/arabinose dehydrogenase/mono/diheme cytochrome c family protein
MKPAGMTRHVGILTYVAFLTLMGGCKGSNDNTDEMNQVAGEHGFDTPHTVSQDPSTNPLPPEQSLKTFRLPAGYRLEVVANEPMISEPVAIAWDGNGRMFVAQLETYMQTVDAVGQNEPHSRIMLLEDTDNDGRMDKASVFLDSLLSPRMILCVGRELFVNETNTYNIYAYRDSDGDGMADQKRTVFETKEKAFGNVEHQRSGLDWNLDNWIYVTIDPVRFRYRNGQLKVDSLVSGSNGQWGLTHDNYGRLFFSRAASGMAATGFQINPSYGQLDFDDATPSDFAEAWPIIKTPDVNGGPRTLRSDSTLQNFTSITGQSVFRGDRLPKSMIGDYIVAEPVGRFIRRADVLDSAGKITLANVYAKDEFIASTDMNFRPVNTYTGPDGCLYIVDMYRGIIQESTWAQPGSFLYSQIMNKRLNRNIKNGRIYRLVYDGLKPGPQPRMLDEPTEKLIAYLDHPNGWWRDNAQKEIIVRGDKSVVPAIVQIAAGEEGVLKNPPSAIARLHAMWTLEGLGEINQEFLLKLLQDPDIQIRKAAIRMSESFLKNNEDETILSALTDMVSDKSQDVLGQLMLSLSVSRSPEATALAQQVMDRNQGNELLNSIQKSIQKNVEGKRYGYKLMALKEADRKSVIEGATIFKTLCVTCHGPEGQGLPTNIAPHLISKFKLIEQREGIIKIMLHGLTGPVDGVQYNDIMPAMGTNSDAWIASVLNYVRYDLCMRSFPRMGEGYINWVIIQPEQVKKIRDQYAARKTPWTWQEILATDNPN